LLFATALSEQGCAIYYCTAANYAGHGQSRRFVFLEIFMRRFRWPFAATFHQNRRHADPTHPAPGRGLSRCPFRGQSSDLLGARTSRLRRRGGAPLLVVILHGVPGDAASYDRGSGGWSALADEAGVRAALSRAAAEQPNNCFSAGFAPAMRAHGRGEESVIHSGLIMRPRWWRHGLDGPASSSPACPFGGRGDDLDHAGSLSICLRRGRS
jgi:hypothetical protein